MLKISVVWNDSTSTSRKLDIYASNTPFTDAEDLYGNTDLKIGTLGFGETTFDVTGDYQYVGFRSNDGAMYLDKIEVVWEE